MNTSSQTTGLFSVWSFIDGLTAAMRGVVSIEARDQTNSLLSKVSAWLITDRLVLTTDVVTKEATRFTCQAQNRKGLQRTDIRLVATVPGVDERPGIALFRLAKKIKEKAFALEPRTPGLDTEVCLLQFFGEVSFSLSSVNYIDDQLLGYKAPTVAGSAGGPIVDLRTWAVVGMHLLALNQDNGKRGLRLDPILNMLKTTPCWDEIATYQNIATVTAPEPAPVAAKSVATTSPALVKAALNWQFKKEELQPAEAEEIAPFVVNKGADEWSLKGSERQRILKSAGWQNVLQNQDTSIATASPGQDVIDRILQGPPYNLDAVPEDRLPYWLQAVRWFGDVAPGLPAAAEVNAVMERKKMRSRLEDITRGFEGRARELKILDDWYSSSTAGPLLVSGIGGIGKSALVAHLALTVPEGTLVLWLDFDRADLTPNDALPILDAIATQAASQIDGFPKNPPLTDSTQWPERARTLGEQITAHTTGNPVLVLDGFEVAQQVREYHEIWKVLEELTRTAPKIRVIVSGRAPAGLAQLNSKSTEPLTLTGLEPKDAERWLQANGITDPELVKQVLELSEGIPLRLKLAAHYLKTADERDLDVPIEKALVEGYLYRRILDRVIDDSLKDLVKDILVLRRCSRPMITGLFGDKLPEIVTDDDLTRKLTADEVFSRLSREMALVSENSGNPSFVMTGDADVLELRPEVRTATLRLLEFDNAQRVKEVDELAAGWYEKQDLSDEANAAELVYHYLRLHRLEDAKKIWRIECTPLLAYALDDLPKDATAERAWLSERIDPPVQMNDTLRAWEISAALDLRSRFAFGPKGFEETLDYRKERSPESPLLVYDAWRYVLGNDWTKAGEILANAQRMEGPVQRARDIVHAYIARNQGDWEGSVGLLSPLDKKEVWADRSGGPMEGLALRAAIVRNLVDIPAELDLYEALKKYERSNIVARLNEFLSRADLVTPLLNDLFSGMVSLEMSSAGIVMPMNEGEMPTFRSRFEGKRLARSPFALALEDDFSYEQAVNWYKGKMADDSAADPRAAPRVSFPMEAVFALAYKGYRRWKLATTDTLLYDLAAPGEKQKSFDALHLSIAGTLAAFRGETIGMPWTGHAFIDRRLKSIVHNSIVEGLPAPALQRTALLDRYLVSAATSQVDDRSLLNEYLGLKEMIGRIMYDNKINIQTGESIFEYFHSVSEPSLISMSLYLLGPDPLEMLVRRTLGYTDFAKID